MGRAMKVMWAWSFLGVAGGWELVGRGGAAEDRAAGRQVPCLGRRSAVCRTRLPDLRQTDRLSDLRTRPDSHDPQLSHAKDVPGEANDHSHHKSMWFAHGDVNGESFWDERGKIVNDKVLDVDTDPQQPSVTLANKLIDRDG